LNRIASILLLALLLLPFTGCEKDPSQKTDAELGLNEQQAQGRRVFQLYCSVCHKPYSSSPLKGPGLKGLYRHEYLPSGLLADDRFVQDTIIRGRKMMPPMGNSLRDDQIADVIAYLHTL
jgi:mono/diheme cytochrome c family protein